MTLTSTLAGIPSVTSENDVSVPGATVTQALQAIAEEFIASDDTDTLTSTLVVTATDNSTLTQAEDAVRLYFTWETQIVQVGQIQK